MGEEGDDAPAGEARLARVPDAEQAHRGPPQVQRRHSPQVPRSHHRHRAGDRRSIPTGSSLSRIFFVLQSVNRCLVTFRFNLPCTDSFSQFVFLKLQVEAA